MKRCALCGTSRRKMTKLENGAFVCSVKDSQTCARRVRKVVEERKRDRAENEEG